MFADICGLEHFPKGCSYPVYEFPDCNTEASSARAHTHLLKHTHEHPRDSSACVDVMFRHDPLSRRKFRH